MPKKASPSKTTKTSSSRRKAKGSGGSLLSRRVKLSLRNPFILGGILLFAIVGPLLVFQSFAASSHTLKASNYSLSAVNAEGYAKTSLTRLITSGYGTLNAGSGCKDAFAKQAKSGSVHWGNSDVMCWNASDLSGGWSPQAIAGSGSSYSSEAPAGREIILAGMYTTGHPSGLVATPGSSGQASRMTIIDAGNRHYRHVELAKPCGSSANKVCKLDAHVGGMAWVGNTLYVAATSGMYVFNFKDMYVIGGHPVMVASKRWSFTNGSDKISTVSLDRSSTPDALVTAEYRTDSEASGKVMRWNLSGESIGGATATADTAFTKMRYMQGVAANKGSYAATSSKYDEILRWKGAGGATTGYRVPKQNAESLYIDYSRSKMWSLTELPFGSSYRFVFSLPSYDIF
ncbi:MAG: hypothetical protein JWN01_356 [Patescibacteria group bacterium]|nr:hypothetical protein [Patescibacteria group bacterium]